MAQIKSKPKTSKKTSRSSDQSMDGVFLLKLMLYVIIGSLWIKPYDDTGGILLPIGIVIGLLFAVHEHFQIDRKIEFAVLVVAMMLGYFAPFGLYVTF